MERRDFMISVGLGMAALSLPGCLKKGVKPGQKPNIIFIMSDDHAAQAISAYGSRINKTPNIDRLATGGARFENCFCTNGICAPSRAVILTGKHSHLNGLRDNSLVFGGAQPTFPPMLQAAGYQTVMLGKWHLKSDPIGFDYWNILPGQGAYYNPDMIEMGKKSRHEGYVTDLLTDMALDYFKNKRDPQKPFMMMLHNKAPHRNWQPAPRHLTMYDDTDFPEPETLWDDYATRSDAAREQEMTLEFHMQEDYDLKMGDPPQRLNDVQREAWEKAYGPKKEAFAAHKPEGKDLVRWKYKRYMEDYLGCIASVDESIGRLLDYLEESGLAENTMVVYTSDQGFFLGEHGWFDKRFMYEESLRMPLVVQLPGTVEPGSTNSDLVSNLDFAPTFLALAGLDAPADMQGESLKPLLSGKTPDGWRESVYYHYYEYPAVHQAKRHYGVRTIGYKLMHFYDDIDAWELYDLEKDPNELNNVYDDPGYTDIAAELKTELARLRVKYGDSEELDQKFIREDAERRKR